jgi:hypothetical protein
MTLRIIFSIALAFYLSGCLFGDTKCCEYIGSYPISKGIYLEKYRTFCAGVWGEVISCYLTDSTNFRQKIGSYDEHESFDAKLNGDKIEAYNFQSTLISDTIDTKTIVKADLWNYHNSDTNCIKTSPVFGKNSIKCDNDFYPMSSYKNDDGYFMTEVQYKCGNEFSNAVFFTDSLNFCVFLGVYNPGSFENNYRVKKYSEDSFKFYNITDKWKVDTVKVENYLLTDLKKGRLINVCQ